MSGYLIDLEGKKNVDESKLSPRHRIFAEEYVANGMRIEAAAKAAQYRGNNLSIVGSKILRNAKVRAYIGKLLSKYTEDRELRTYEILGVLQRVRKFNLMNAASKAKDGFIEINAEDYQRIADEIGDCVTEVSSDSTEMPDGSRKSRIRIKLMSKERLLELEMRYYGMLIERKQVDRTDRKLIDWDSLVESTNGVPDFIEGKIASIEEQST